MLKTIKLESMEVAEKTYPNKWGKEQRLVKIRAGGVYYSGFMAEVPDWSEGQIVMIDHFTTEKGGVVYNNFKLPSKLDLLELRVKRLEEAISNSGAFEGTLDESKPQHATKTGVGHKNASNAKSVRSTGIVDEGPTPDPELPPFLNELDTDW